ncbi:MAG: response regulator [Myxococcota bacterium]
MVVDDDQGIRTSLRDVLELSGYEVWTFADGTSALAWLRNGGRAPQAILLDLVMAGMDGWAFREAQLKDPAVADIPVIVVSSADRWRERPIQADGYLEKPYLPPVMLAEIERVRRRK